MSSVVILENFKKNLVLFLDELIGQFPTEGDLVVARILIKDQVPILTVMQYMCRVILPLRKLVEDRDEKFILENNILFDSFGRDIGKDKVNHFKKLWRSGRLDDDDKETIFKWFDTFIFLADRYQKSLV